MDSFYALDQNDVIVETGGWWDQFADANNGAGARSEAVLGTCLWDANNSRETYEYLSAVFQDSRDKMIPRCLTYRCDSPERPRLFQMEIDPLPSGGLSVHHKFVTKFKPVFSLSVASVESAANDTYCSICFSIMDGAFRIDPANMSEAKDPHDGVPFCPRCKDVAQRA